MNGMGKEVLPSSKTNFIAEELVTRAAEAGM